LGFPFAFDILNPAWLISRQSRGSGLCNTESHCHSLESAQKICFTPAPVSVFLVANQFKSNHNQSMKNIFKTIGLAACALAFAGTASAQDTVTGKWQGQFDSQIGMQTYTYDFKADGTNLTGRAVGISESRTNDAAITEGKINQDEISFVEPLKFGDNDIRIEYTGKVSGDEIKLHRKVGDFAEEDLVAKRVKDGDAQPAATMDTNSPPAKP
jgi:hypothetical protein